MKKGIRGHDIQAHGINNISTVAQEKGFEYLQLVLERSIDTFVPNSFTEEYALEIKKQLGNTKIAVLGSYINPSNPDDEALRADIEKFKDKIKYASVLNPIVVGTETGIYKEGMTNSEEAYQRVLGTIKELTSEAEKYNVNIGIEGVHFFVINSPQKLRRLMDDVNSDNIKAIFDPLNHLTADNYTEQDTIISQTFDLLSDKICAIHAKDFTVDENGMRGEIPGFGMLNYKLIFDKIKEYNLDIPIICENINDDDASKAFEKLKDLQNNS